MYSKILYSVEKSKRVSANYRFDPETIAKIEAVAEYYNITSTAAIEVSITNELERIDIIKAKRQRVRKKRITPTPAPFRGDVLSAEVWERQKKLLTPTPTPPTP